MIRSTSTILIACLLTACGGGGGGGSTASTGTGTSGGNPAVPVDKTGPSVGDFYTYKMTGYSESGGNRYTYQPAYDTELTTGVASGTATVKMLQGFQFLGWFGDSATLKGPYLPRSRLSCTTTYTADAYGPPEQLALNVSWDNSTSYTQDCVALNTVRNSKLSSKGKVVAEESITIAAGTFQAYKLTATMRDESTEKDRDGRPFTTLTTIRTSQLTSWVDVDTGVELKRSVEEAKSGPNMVDSYTYSMGRELIGLSHAKSGRQLLALQRFESPSWKGSYSGKLSGTCMASLSDDGTIYASCEGDISTFQTSSPQGTMNNSGQVNFALKPGSAGAPKFTGQAESLTKISGTWSDGAGATGNWVFTRDN